MSAAVHSRCDRGELHELRPGTYDTQDPQVASHERVESSRHCIGILASGRVTGQTHGSQRLSSSVRGSREEILISWGTDVTRDSCCSRACLSSHWLFS